MIPHLPEDIQVLAEHQAAFFRIFGNPQRVLILWLLAERERTINEVALAIGASQESTLHHLRILGFSNMVETRRELHVIYYRISENELLRNCLVFTNRPRNISLEVNPI